MAVNTPIIPNEIVVHIGKPTESGKIITVPFTEYIKNVASSEIYPNWPTDAIKANVLAQISFALNRIYNEWYRTQGYNYDITSSPAYDQTFIEDRVIYDKISKVVDEIFNNYIVREGQIQPLYAVYCDGKNTTCNGLSQWGSVTLANNGKSFQEILKNYYGKDISIILNAPLYDNIESYPGFPFKIGNAGDPVIIIKKELNRIANNYPAIPKVSEENEFFTPELENSVKKFQEIFNLPVTGEVDKATWYKLKYLYAAVKKLTSLSTEGISEEEATLLYNNELKPGNTGEPVKVLQYLLQTIAFFDEDIPYIVAPDGIYGPNTKTMVEAFQQKYALPVTGIVNRPTWAKIRFVYNDTLENLDSKYLNLKDEYFPGRFMLLGMTGDDIKLLQEYLYIICTEKKLIPGVRVNGTYDELTKESVEALQRYFDVPVTGVVGPASWKRIVELSKQ